MEYEMSYSDAYNIPLRSLKNTNLPCRFFSTRIYFYIDVKPGVKDCHQTTLNTGANAFFMRHICNVHYLT